MNDKLEGIWIIATRYLKSPEEMSASQVILPNALMKGSQLPSVGPVTLLQRSSWEHRDEIQFSSIHYKKPILLMKVSAFTDSYSSQDKQTFAHQCGLHP